MNNNSRSLHRTLSAVAILAGGLTRPYKILEVQILQSESVLTSFLYHANEIDFDPATLATAEIDFVPGPFRCQIEQQHLDFAIVCDSCLISIGSGMKARAGRTLGQ